MRPTIRLLNLLALLVVLSVGQARAGLIFTLQEVGPNVVLSGSGTVDLTGFSFVLSGGVAGNLDPDAFFLAGGPTGTISINVGTVTGPSNIGPGTVNISASSGTGDLFGLDFSGAVAVPVGYLSGAALSGTSTFLASSFAALGVTAGTYDWTLGNGDTISLVIGNVTAVPEPPVLALLLVGLGLAALRRRQPAK